MRLVLKMYSHCIELLLLFFCIWTRNESEDVIPSDLVRICQLGRVGYSTTIGILQPSDRALIDTVTFQYWGFIFFGFAMRALLQYEDFDIIED